MWGDGETVFLLGIAACCCVASLLWLRRRRLVSFVPKHSLPPSPPSLPIVGHLHLLVGKQLPHQTLYELATKHGPLMHLRLGMVPTIVASSPDMAREILKTHDAAFCSRPRITAVVTTVYNCSDIAWAPYGPYYRHMRQIFVNNLLSPKRMEAFEAMREEEGVALARSVWTEGPGHAIELQTKLSAMSNNIISRMAVGARFKEMTQSTLHDPSIKFEELIHKLLEIHGAFFLGDYLPLLRWLDPQSHLHRMKAIAKQMDMALQSVIDQRRADNQHHEKDQKQHDDVSSTDLLDVLLAAASDSSSGIRDDNVKGVLWDVFSGGTDTSSLTAEWGLAELLRSPVELAKLQHELDSVVGTRRLMHESDISRLPFLQAVVKETMRLHPAGPLLVPRESIHDCKVAGFHVAAKTRVLVNVWAAGRDENYWERPLEFLPDRFMGSSTDVQGQHFQLLPFGAGRRGCPGLRLGLSIVHMMVGVLVHAFDWRATQQGIDMVEGSGLAVSMAHPLVAISTPRLPSSCFDGV